MVLFRSSSTSLEMQHRHEVLRIQAWGTDSVRVRAAQHRIPEQSHGALEDPPASGVGPTITVGDSHATLVQGELTVDVDFDRAAAYPEPLVTFSRTSSGAELLAEEREHFWMPGARVFIGNRSGAYEIHQQFKAYDGEKLSGMGIGRAHV